MKKLFYILIACLISSSLYAQSLDDYIQEGLKTNIVLQQKQASYEKSLLALKEAKAYYYPEIFLQARYSVSEGGRTIDLPIGDMLNPVYTTLNQITSQLYALGMASDVFPLMSVDNQEIQFFRPKEHETKLSLRQALFSSDIYFNQKIKDGLSEIEKIDIDLYKRHLVAEIKTAYFNYLKAVQLQSMLEKNKEVLQEFLRVNQKLYENDKVTIEKIYQSESELSKLEIEFANADKNLKMAVSYFNFLLNRNLDEEINKDSYMLQVCNVAYLQEAMNIGMTSREELSKLNTYIKTNDYNIKLNKFKKAPELFLAVDYGFQGEEYRFTADDDFVIASLVLKWNIFNGLKNQSKLRQVQIQKDILQNQYAEAKSQINLQVRNAYYDLEASSKAIQSSEKELISSKAVFNIIQKKYREGMVNYLEFINALNAQSASEEKLIIYTYDYQIKYAEFEKAAALYNFQNIQIN